MKINDSTFFRDLLEYARILGKLDRTNSYEEKAQLTICKEAVEIVLELYPKCNLERMK